MLTVCWSGVRPVYEFVSECLEHKSTTGGHAVGTWCAGELAVSLLKFQVMALMKQERGSIQ